MRLFAQNHFPFPSKLRSEAGALILLCCGLLAAGPVQAATIIVSAPIPEVPVVNTCYPFSDTAPGYTSTHYQQIYSNLILNTPFTIKAIDFYTDPNLGGQLLDNATWNIRIAATTQWINNLGDMSHSIVDDAAHQHTFTPETFYTGQLTIGAGGVVRIAGAPFAFNPTGRNLIIDIVRTPSGTPTTSGAQLLAQSGGYGSRCYNDLNQWGSGTNPAWNYPFSSASDYWNVNDPNRNENYGLITGFEYDLPTPEPGTFLMMGGGLAIAFFARRRVRRHA